MLGLAATDRVWTALRRPPLFTFSGDQPCSTAIGRMQLGGRLVGDEGGERVAERSRARSVEGRVHGLTCPSCVVLPEGPGGRSAELSR